MTQIVHKFGDAEVGDIVNLKSGSPDAVIIGFEGPEPVTPVTAPGAPNLVGASYKEAEPVARVVWFGKDDLEHIGRWPIPALNLKAKTEPKHDALS